MSDDRGRLRAMRLLPFTAAAVKARLTLNTATALASYRWLDLRERGSSRESRSGLQGP
jgi:hypothetical protein